jgi:hypothetical protein
MKEQNIHEAHRFFIEARSLWDSYRSFWSKKGNAYGTENKIKNLRQRLFYLYTGQTRGEGKVHSVF